MNIDLLPAAFNTTARNDNMIFRITYICFVKKTRTLTRRVSHVVMEICIKVQVKRCIVKPTNQTWM